MAKLIPPLFTRLYLGIILALFGSIMMTLYFSEESITKSAMVDFHADTRYIFDEISSSIKHNGAEPEAYIQSLPKKLLVFDIRWLKIWNGSLKCENCKYLYTLDNNLIYERDDENLLAVFPLANSRGAILIGDLSHHSDWPDNQTIDEFNMDNLANIWQETPEDLLPLLMLLVAILAISAPLYFPIRQLQKQINQLIDTNERFGHGELTVRASHNLSEPVSSLATSFNQMANSITETVTENQIFAQAVPHEMRTPLSRIQLATGLLRKSCTEPQQVALLDNIDTYIDDIDELTKQVLTFSKLNAITSEGNAASKKLIELEPYLDERIIQLNQEQTKQVILYCHQQQLECDPVCLRLMFDNLVKNAIRYAKSTVIISVEMKQDLDASHASKKKSSRSKMSRRANQANAQLIITVADDGPGIAKEDFDTIFIPFSRLDKSRNQQTGGLGLGLAIAKSATKRMSGELSVSRNPEGGARFCCRLPSGH
ncbi:signal transduction histidine kinase [Shewanella psychrophila]|uniref:histidine kinase n=1 Tax=Shewanella psychrophila TaxID=225848 RepID=A0A1S6HUT8_9GAMM|nr:ATP-binding protein [Shewanella psychrophila]AQS39261.1 signal transduction histidine kinase [Shewanella psychrophila]